MTHESRPAGSRHLGKLQAGVSHTMSDNMKPDLGHCGSDGEDDGNTCHSFDQYSMEEIQMCLECLVLFAATAGFLAFQLVTNAIFEEEYERDVAWIAKQSRSMSSIDDEDDYKEDMEFEDSEDEDQEELQDQMEEAEEDEAEDEMHLEAGAAISLDDLTACTCKSPMVFTLDSG